MCKMRDVRIIDVSRVASRLSRRRAARHRRRLFFVSPKLRWSLPARLTSCLARFRPERTRRARPKKARSSVPPASIIGCRSCDGHGDRGGADSPLRGCWRWGLGLALRRVRPRRRALHPRPGHVAQRPVAVRSAPDLAFDAEHRETRRPALAVRVRGDAPAGHPAGEEVRDPRRARAVLQGQGYALSRRVRGAQKPEGPPVSFPEQLLHERVRQHQSQAARARAVARRAPTRVQARIASIAAFRPPGHGRALNPGGGAHAPRAQARARARSRAFSRRAPPRRRAGRRRARRVFAARRRRRRDQGRVLVAPRGERTGQEPSVRVGGGPGARLRLFFHRENENDPTARVQVRSRGGRARARRGADARRAAEGAPAARRGPVRVRAELRGGVRGGAPGEVRDGRASGVRRRGGGAARDGATAWGCRAAGQVRGVLRGFRAVAPRGGT